MSYPGRLLLPQVNTTTGFIGTIDEFCCVDKLGLLSSGNGVVVSLLGEPVCWGLGSSSKVL